MVREISRPEEEFCGHHFWLGQGCPVCEDLKPETRKIGKVRTTQVGGDHYKAMKIQPFDVYDSWPKEQQIGAYRALALKYMMRMGNKEGNSPLEEAEKALHVTEKLVEVLRDGEDL